MLIEEREGSKASGETVHSSALRRADKGQCVNQISRQPAADWWFEVLQKVSIENKNVPTSMNLLFYPPASP
jgi:hypothetical protein